jgi:hypothetical protein
MAAATLSFLFGRALPGVLANYKTEIPLHTFYGVIAIGLLLGGALLFGGYVLLFGFAWNFAGRAFGEQRLPSWLGMPPDYYRDAFWIGLGGSALLVGLRRTIDVILSHWPTHRHDLPTAFGGSYDAIYPAAAIIGGAIVTALLLTGVLALAGGFVGAELRVRWLRLTLFLAVAAALVSSPWTGLGFVKEFIANLILLGFVVFGIRRVARFNILGWFLVAACTVLLGGAMELLSQPDSFYKVNGYAVLAFLVALFAWPLASWRMATGGVQEKT